MVKTNRDPFNIDPEPQGSKPRKARRPQVYVTDNMRLQLLLMITEFGLSCYQTAKILNLPYTNAKVIYRVFREEKRIISYSRNISKAPTFREDYQLLQNYPMLRQDALVKLGKALKTELLTEPQRARIYQ